MKLYRIGDFEGRDVVAKSHVVARDGMGLYCRLK